MAGRVQPRPAGASGAPGAMPGNEVSAANIDASADATAVVTRKRVVKTPFRKIATTSAGKIAGAKDTTRPVVKKIVRKKAPSKKNVLKTSAVEETPVAPAVIDAPPENAPQPPDIDKPAIRRSVTGRALVTRVARAVERELAEIEAIVGKPKSRTEAERRVRTLASLARTIGEVMRLREQQQTRRDDDDDTVPRDLDEFRDTLARRLEHIIAARSLRVAGDSEPE